MVSFHPDSKFLTDFTAGNLPVSEAICVAAHLEFCAKCRSHVQQLSDLGAHLMSNLDAPATQADDQGFESLMRRIEAGDTDPVTLTPVRTQPNPLGLPRVVQKMTDSNLQSLNWAQFGKSLRIAPIKLGEKDRKSVV